MDSGSAGKRIPRLLALLLVLVALVAAVGSSANAQKPPKKLSKQDIINLLTGDVPGEEVAQEARKSGISFELTPSAIKDIRDAGGSDELIRVLRTLAPQAPAPPHDTARNVPVTSSPVLVIESSPGQIQVYVDDESMGTTSQQGRLKMTHLTPGEHRVRLALDGYEDHEQTVTLAAGQTTTVAATLQPIAVGPHTEPPQPEPPQPEPAQPVTQGQAGFLGVQLVAQQPAGARGVVISGARPGGPADQAGLKTSDTIVAINGRRVSTPQELRTALATHPVGETVQITWYNGSTYVTKPVRLSAPPGGGRVSNSLETTPVETPTLTNMPHNGLVSFHVAHDHGQSGQNYCVGTMSIGNGMIYYKSENGVHSFEIPLNTVREARRNSVYLMALGAFHIRLNKGTNFNFVALDQQNHYQPPDAILTAIDRAMGK
jgi:hypothetical protein